jgi:hypothetical protein
MDRTDRVIVLSQTRRLLVAAIDPNTFVLHYANEAFCRLFGIEIDATGALCREIGLFDLIPQLDKQRIQQLPQSQVCTPEAGREDQQDNCRDEMAAESLSAMIHSPLYPEDRLIEFWLSNVGSNSTTVRPIEDGNPEASSPLAVSHEKDDGGASEALKLREKRHCRDTERRDGLLLLEGIDVTVRETLRQVSRLLIGRVSILTAELFCQIDHYLRALFSAQHSFILCLEREPARLFMAGGERQELEITRYPMDSLLGSDLVRAAQTNEAYAVPAMSTESAIELDRRFQALGVCSLLLIPLHVRNEGKGAATSQLVGLIGLTSDQPDYFTRRDVGHAQELIEPFTVALRYSMQQRLTSFSNIQHAVEWRFLEEAERRNWGLPPQPIEFPEVYPLYGISDIRGSSDARNQAIQADLLRQFQLGVAVVDAIVQQRESALARQVRLDLLEYIEELQQGVDVDAEVTAIDYLKERLEIYFDCFSSGGDAAVAAVQAYQQACDNDQHCVYETRARYDAAVSRVTGSLRETWERWQARMQQIIPHYCDINCTDGIDHMIYAGYSIDPNFCPFHLHSLRYEQLRAVCDCARTALQIGSQDDTELQTTHLVLVQHLSVDIFHDEKSDNLFAVRGSRDTRYEIVKKRIDKASDAETGERITRPGMLALVYSTDEEWLECQQYLRYLAREGWIDPTIESGTVEPLQGISGLMFARVSVLPEDPRPNTTVATVLALPA